MTEKENQKLQSIIDEFDKNFTLEGDNEFMVEFAEKNFKEFIEGADELIAKLNRFTNKKSLKVMLYVFIFGLLIDYLYGENSRSGEIMDAALVVFSNFLSEANLNLTFEREKSKLFEHALDKLQNKQCNKEDVAND